MVFQENALSGIKVLDVSEHIAGSYCTKLFAELGAEVIKVEKPQGDATRKMGPFFKEGPLSEKSGLFFYLNTGKKGVTLNLNQNRGKKIFKRLAEEADIIVESFGPGVMSDLELDFTKLKEINSHLIMTSISNFGQSGPYKNWQSSDLVVFAMSGLCYSSFGTPDRHPIKPFGSIAEHVAGLYAAVGTMIAFYHRMTTGLGQHIDISVLDCVTSCEAHQVPMLAYEGVIRKRTNLLHPTTHPMTILPCKDGYLGFAIGTPAQWQRLCLIAGLPEDWREDDSPFMEGLYRRAHYGEINDALMPWLTSHTRQEIQEIAQEVLIPITGVKTIPEVVHDPQYRARDFFTEIEHVYAGKIALPGLPFKMGETPGQIKRAPLLGEHNEDIYCEHLGYSREELVRLREQDII